MYYNRSVSVMNTERMIDMATSMTRVTISIPPDMEADIKMLKQVMFYDKPYSELYRQMMRLGIDVLKEKRHEKDKI